MKYLKECHTPKHNSKINKIRQALFSLFENTIKLFWQLSDTSAATSWCRQKSTCKQCENYNVSRNHISVDTPCSTGLFTSQQGCQGVVCSTNQQISTQKSVRTDENKRVSISFCFPLTVIHNSDLNDRFELLTISRSPGNSSSSNVLSLVNCNMGKAKVM